MKKLLFIFAFITLSASAGAQTIEWNKSNSKVRIDSIAKEILEPAQYLVTYTYRYVKDPQFPDDKKTGMTILQVGKRYNRFADYNELRFDSINDELYRGKIPFGEGTSMMMGSLKKKAFTEGIVLDMQHNKATIQRTAGLSQKYQYEESLPQLAWEILTGDTIIAGYHCNKAKTSLFGRDYIAWFSPEITMPYGPYKFYGLPGLVLSVKDTQGQFEFTLDGLQKALGYQPIYLWTKKNIVKTSRKAVRKIYKNFCADPVGALTSSGNVIVPKDVGATVQPKPYNPMELE